MYWKSWLSSGLNQNRMAERANEMNQNAEHLRLLAIFHYVVAGLAALFSFFPLLYTALGVIFIIAARHGTAKPGHELPPEFLGWIFAALGSVLFATGI